MADSFVTVLNRWDNLRIASEKTGVPYPKLRQFKRSNYIPGEWWRAIVTGAQASGFADVGLGLLARIGESRVAKILAKERQAQAKVAAKVVARDVAATSNVVPLRPKRANRSVADIKAHARDLARKARARKR